ncbi:hypothetical protein ACQ33O_08580 [Ferruginibacter sp. SUN002]|uniref:hypothetical protein n=1 Tax=Ferruginibacter sp. SUN002 TaxID=2937789 RepID=UPI003D3700C9
MRYCTLFILLLFTLVFGNAQDIVVVKSVAGTAEEPKNASQDEWENNKWNGKLFYRAKGSSCKLAVTDGTDVGTKVIADLGASNIINFIPAADFIYIVTNETVFTPSFGIIEKIWKSDGTTVGTLLVLEFAAHGFTTSGLDAGTDVENDRNYSVTGNLMYFTGYDATNGAEPWITNGTAAGTHIIKDIKTGASPSYADGYIQMNGNVYFRAASSGTAATLWRTDGTEAGTVEIVVPTLTIWSTTIAKVNNKLIFIGNDNFVTGPEPWVSDGTVEGTFMLKDINTGGTGSNTTAVQNIHLRFNDQYVFFVAASPTGNALWRTDGTVSGTIQLTLDGVYSGTNYSGGGFCAISNQRTFWINDNSKLYVTDGSPAGTSLLRNDLTNAIFMVLYNNAAHFNSGAAGSRELWKSDGATANTTQYVDVNPGVAESYPYGLFTLSNNLYFFANNGSGVKLLKLSLSNTNSGFVFNGNGSTGNWTDPLNWSGSQVPGITDTVFINSGTPLSPVVNGTVYTGILNLAAGATINLPNSSDTLVVSLALNTNNNTITGNGVLSLQGGTINELMINGILSLPKLYIRNKVTLQSGVLNITGQ